MNIKRYIFILILRFTQESLSKAALADDVQEESKMIRAALFCNACKSDIKDSLPWLPQTISA